MIGENFTREYKYPIKIYKIYKFSFPNGVEARKLIASGISILFIVALFLLLGTKVNKGILSFFKQNWLIVIVFVPSLIVFLIFNLDYENKGIIKFFRDRISYLFNRKKQYEHFIEVPRDQMNTDLKFESFIAERGDNDNV